jgi:ectoine hydroxylase-related dioxygenase (phytanoyl-CoA dioxygenase family)
MEADPHVLEALRRDGVATIPGVLSRNDALSLRAPLKQCIDDDMEHWKEAPGYVDQWMVHNLMVRGEPFLRLLENERLHAYLSAVLGPTCIIYAYTSSSMPPSGSNFSRRIHVDSPRVIENYVTNVGVLLALDDFTEDNGASSYMSGSQWQLLAPTEEAFVAGTVRPLPRAGDAVIFNARTWHRGGVNTTDQARHAISMNVCRSYMRQRFDYPRLVPKELSDLLGPVGRRFLGFDVRMPASLEEYYVEPEQRLYKAGQG